MWTFEQIAEQRIREAIERGDFDDLDGQGRPLVLEEDEVVPSELRMAYKVLKNAGYVPEEVDLRRDIAEVEDLLGRVQDPGEHARAVKRLNLLRARLAARRRHEPRLHLEADYYHKALRRLGGSR